MRRSRRVANLVLSLLAAAGLLGGCVACDLLEASQPVTPSNPPSTLSSITLSELPSQAQDTLRLIKSDGPFPYSQDGAVFHNYEKILPIKPDGYYHEYTVITPGSPDRGARRIVAGISGEHYYTDDHYNSFRWIEE
jgi:ribonuclease T1